MLAAKLPLDRLFSFLNFERKRTAKIMDEKLIKNNAAEAHVVANSDSIFIPRFLKGVGKIKCCRIGINFYMLR